MKLLMTADTVGGVWTYAMELCGALRPHGIEVALATMGQPVSSVQEQEANALDNVTLFESAFRLEWMEDPWDDVKRAGAWLLRLRDRVQPNLIHLNGYAHGALDWRTPLLVAGHSCVWSWWQAVLGTFPPPQWNRYRDEVARGLKAAATVVAPSKAMMASLEELYGPFASVAVVPNGRDPRRFRAAGKLPIILSAGRLWDAAKNVAALAELAGELPWTLYIAGENRFENHRAALPQDSGSGAIRYLGHLTPRGLADWMGKASIFVMPARYEPFGFTALEAALSGCALVLGDIPSLRENWEGAAVFIRPDSRIEIKNAIQELITHSERLQELAQRARERALQFTADRMAGGYMRIYEALCGSFSSITR